MDLKAIKLAGFKSFVDPTVIPIEKALTAIVGPNGCGKSNVVDAIRCVIGELSAKQLRGQSMADVIFNGTTQRPPVGKASVELVFDNSDHTITGEYAAYNEISIRREIEREGSSSYFLNGAVCRRKDIVDLFLGTGMGARSYSIIEQGMVSRLIEAKPEEMRVYIDEASGISKYKERRRETENRMRHTQENLDRLNDVCEELAKQLAHLKRQANAAERYKDYKTEKYRIDAELKALQWQTLQKQIDSFMGRMRDAQTQLESYAADLTEVEKNIERVRAESVEATAEQSEVQREYYSLGSDIANLEQKIQFTQQRTLQWTDELEEASQLHQELSENILIYTEQVKALKAAVSNIAPEIERLTIGLKEAEANHRDAEQQMQDWQARSEAFQTEMAAALQSIEVAKTKSQHFSQQLSSLQNRQLRLQDQRQQAGMTELEYQLDELNENETVLESQMSDIKAREQEVIVQINTQRQVNNEQNKKVNTVREHLQTTRAQFASLEALQASALNHQNKSVNDWLEQHQWSNQPKLAQQLQVEAGYEVAVETVLHSIFDAVAVDSLDKVFNCLDQLPEGQLMIMTPKAQTVGTSAKATLLSEKMTANIDLSHWLSGVYIADDYVQALSIRSQLVQNESVITKDGVWLGSHWVRVSKVIDATSGVLVREQQLKELKQKIAQLEQHLLVEEAVLQSGEMDLKQFEDQREECHQQLSEHNEQWTRLQSDISAKQARLAQLQEQQLQVSAELAEVVDQIQLMQENIESAKENIEVNEEKRLSFSKQRELLSSQKNSAEAVLLTVREQLQKVRLELDRAQHSERSKRDQLNVLEQTLAREQKQLQQLSVKKQALSEQLNNEDEPISVMRLRLDTLLESRGLVEEKLNLTGQAAEALIQQLNQLEKSRTHLQSQIELHKTQLNNLNLEKQEYYVRQQTIIEQLEESNQQLKEILENMTEEANFAEWQERSEQLQNQISRLGPINLAAIDEHQQINERKTYIDKQVTDLEEALKILQDAISKIDKETRTRFKETFDAVNEGFKVFFPKVFGGGRAYLELTDEDVLLAGVTVKAQPPGKKNSTIHMLSGGEKALTAIALVFSIFQLNPAPFCVLDEVDAPLDEHNVGRFCDLVKEMSSTTQFIVISHNKVTMEMADQLMGVTMKEPGVSRIVSVAINEAVEMALT